MLCFICRDSVDPQEPQYCMCELSHAHEACLRQWIRTSGCVHCSACKRRYDLDFTWDFIVYCGKVCWRCLKLLSEYNLYTGERWDDVE